MTRQSRPFFIFAGITFIGAVADFILFPILRQSDGFIWAYPGRPIVTIAANVWFGQVCAILLTPIILYTFFRVRKLFAVLPWLVPAVCMGAYVVSNGLSFMNTPYDTSEAVWRTFHMPMTSLQTMTFTNGRGYLAQFVYMQVVVAGLILAGYGLSFTVFRGSKK
jgi:hypothetical protein